MLDLTTIRAQICAAMCPSVWKTGEPQPHSEVCNALQSIHPEVWAFMHLMEERLRANDHKPGWKQDIVPALFRRLQEETAELDGAIDFGTAGEIAKETADVANFAMMIADVSGALDS